MEGRSREDEAISSGATMVQSTVIKRVPSGSRAWAPAGKRGLEALIMLGAPSSCR